LLVYTVIHVDVVDILQADSDCSDLKVLLKLQNALQPKGSKISAIAECNVSSIKLTLCEAEMLYVATLKCMLLLLVVTFGYITA